MNQTLHYRPTWSEIRLDLIQENVRVIKGRLPRNCKLMAAVKADAYGHGGIQSAQAALQAGADELAVGILSEAIHLRKNDIQAPILVLTPILPKDVDIVAENEISLTVFQESWLMEMREYKTSGKPLRVHVKMDTGLGRIGIREKSEFEAMLPLLKEEDILVEGVYTHFATANQLDSAFYTQQFERFAEMRKWLNDAGFQGITAHCSNSAAALQYPHNSLDMVRVGAAIFGIYPCEDEVKRRVPVPLKPTLSWHAEIVHIKLVPKGRFIGYDQSYQTTQDEWIATIPIGYADGYLRDFRGFHVLVEGVKVPIIGSIYMDQMIIRLPRHYPVGTKVTLLGRQKESEITLEDLATHIGSVPQAIPSLLTHRVQRVYFNENPF